MGRRPKNAAQGHEEGQPCLRRVRTVAQAAQLYCQRLACRKQGSHGADAAACASSGDRCYAAAGILSRQAMRISLEHPDQAEVAELLAEFVAVHQALYSFD